MHADEAEIDEPLVRRLLAACFPDTDWARRPLSPVASSGTAAGGPPPGPGNFFRGVPLAQRGEPTRAALAVDDATWARGRGWALSVARIQLPYYRDSNPALAANARRTIREVLADGRRAA